MQTSSSQSSSEMIQLQLEYLNIERSIKLKAIVDRENVELLYARKRLGLMRAKLTLGSDECDQNFTGLEEASSEVIDSPPPINLVDDSTSSESTPQGSNQNCVPTSQQICARQVMSVDLPVFTGDPEDWPVFYSQYQNTTRACGYTHSENLVRLQRCLKGKALEYVRSSLMLPELVPKVIKTLEMLYGRPTVLINSLINKIRTIPPPNIDHLETVIDYGMAVQNLFDHLTAMNQKEHLRNPTLLQELEAKLPGQMKLEWARYKRSHGPSSLQTLNGFMKEKVEAACELTFVGVQSNSPQLQNDDLYFQNEIRTHSEGDLPNRNCLVCRRQNHHVRNCAEFQSYGISRRWYLVGELKLCRCCLGRHSSRVCPDVHECGVNGCQMLHHQLLHQTREQ